MHASTSLEEVAELVDRINDIVPVTTQVAATGMPVPGQVASAQPATEQQGSSMEALTQTMAELTRELQVMSAQLRHRSSRPRSRGRYSQNRRRSQSRSGNSQLCYYHNRFGDNARKCTKPCAYTKKALNHQGSQ